MKLFSIILGLCVAVPLGFSGSVFKGIRFTRTPRIGIQANPSHMMPGTTLYPGKTAEQVQFLKKFQLTDDEINSVTPTESLGVEDKDIPSISPEKLAELKNGLSPAEQKYLKGLGLDEDAIKAMTREQFIELRGDNVKLTTQEMTALRKMGVPSDEVAKLTREDLSHIMKAISANNVNN
jgi:hypothetical protein